jgi:hypothetical protein
MHFNLKATRRSGHHHGLLGARGKMQLNRVSGVSGGGLLGYGSHIQTVVARKFHKIISNFGVAIQSRNCSCASGRKMRPFNGAMRAAARRRRAIQDGSAKREG